jgi:hypothetical protein
MTEIMLWLATTSLPPKEVWLSLLEQYSRLNKRRRIGRDMLCRLRMTGLCSVLLLLCGCCVPIAIEGVKSSIMRTCREVCSVCILVSSVMGCVHSPRHTEGGRSSPELYA